MYILDCNHDHVATKYTIEQYTEKNINIYQLSNLNIDEKKDEIYFDWRISENYLFMISSSKYILCKLVYEK